jgi:hypothetical protein
MGDEPNCSPCFETHRFAMLLSTAERDRPFHYGFGLASAFARIPSSVSPGVDALVSTLR